MSVHSDTIDGREAIFQRVDLGPDKGVYHRLQMGPFASRAEARALCQRIREKAPEQPCLIVRPTAR